MVGEPPAQKKRQAERRLAVMIERMATIENASSSALFKGSGLAAVLKRVLYNTGGVFEQVRLYAGGRRQEDLLLPSSCSVQRANLLPNPRGSKLKYTLASQGTTRVSARQEAEAA